MSLTEEVSFGKDGNIERFPLFNKLFLALVILLVAVLSFGIGRLSVMGKSEPIQILYEDLDGKQSTNNLPQVKAQEADVLSAVKVGKSVIASKNGSKYHYSHCAGAKQIKEENKLEFSSPEAAESAGYTLAANCSPR